MTRDDYNEWLQHPVTEYVLGIMQQWADRQKQEWSDMVWDSGAIDPLFLTEARVRADCYRTIPESTFEDWQAIEGKLNDTESE